MRAFIERLRLTGEGECRCRHCGRTDTSTSFGRCAGDDERTCVLDIDGVGPSRAEVRR